MYRSQLSITGNRLFDDAVFIILALIAISMLGNISFEAVDGVNSTLQSLLVVFFSLLLGLRVGLTSVILYLIIGGLGLPVFSNGASGWTYFQGINGGFLLAFPIGALISGAAAEWAATNDFTKRFSFITGAIILLISQLAILILGSFWYNSMMFDGDLISHLSIRIEAYSPGLLVKTALGTIIFVIFGRILSRVIKS